jgi:hypothetical protein
MRLFRWALTAILFVILAAAVYQTALWLGGWGNINDSQVMPLDGGDQEIAYIEPATGIEEWGRLVTALQLLERDWPRVNPELPAVKVDIERAFPQLSATVPEVVFSFTGARDRLRLRWYKITGEHDAASWVRKLRERPRQPLGIVGGGTTERAIKLAKRLQDVYPDADQPSPALLITTATAEKTKKGAALIGLYDSRSFRFSFTNHKMVEALLSFVERRHYPAEEAGWAQNLWVHRPAEPGILPNAVASMAGVGDPWHACGVLGAQPYLQPYAMHAVTWQDERYSQDLADIFQDEFPGHNPLGEFSRESPIQSGVGGFSHPSPEEQAAVGIFLARPTPITPHSFLLLPTQTVRMRRFLINLRQRSPNDARNLVILNGDAISFHNVYRDRDVTWNILDLPYSLVFFAHRNPIDPAAGFAWAPDTRAEPGRSFPQRSTSGTHDVLLYRDIFEALLYAASDRGQVLGDALQVRARLQATCWNHPPAQKAHADSERVCNTYVHGFIGSPRRFFDADGNRQAHTGEHIVWVKPSFTEDRVDLTGKISVWSLHAAMNGGWRLREVQPIVYNENLP